MFEKDAQLEHLLDTRFAGWDHEAYLLAVETPHERKKREEAEAARLK